MNRPSEHSEEVRTYPEYRPVSADLLRMIARQHGLAAGLIGTEPWIGATSCVYPISTHTVVKVPHADADAERSLRIDVSVGPIMRALASAPPV